MGAKPTKEVSPEDPEPVYKPYIIEPSFAANPPIFDPAEAHLGKSQALHDKIMAEYAEAKLVSNVRVRRAGASESGDGDDETRSRRSSSRRSRRGSSGSVSSGGSRKEIPSIVAMRGERRGDSFFMGAYDERQRRVGFADAEDAAAAGGAGAGSGARPGRPPRAPRSSVSSLTNGPAY